MLYPFGFQLSAGIESRDMKNSARSITAGFLVVIVVSGCASIGARQGAQEHAPYQGVKDDIHYMAHSDEADHPSLQWLIAIDLPLSAILDTLLLPFDLAANHPPTKTEEASPQKTVRAHEDSS